jgi:hypothetical protein
MTTAPQPKIASTQQPATLPGPAPLPKPVVPTREKNPIPYQAENDFQGGEVLAVATPQRDVIILTIPRALRKRKIYLWLYPATVLTDFAVTGDISFYLTGQKIGSLPVGFGLSQTGGGSIVPQTVACVCPQATVMTTTENTLTIFPANPATAPYQKIQIQPLYINLTADEIRLSLTGFTAGTISIRAYLACISLGFSKQQNAS